MTRKNTAAKGPSGNPDMDELESLLNGKPSHKESTMTDKKTAAAPTMTPETVAMLKNLGMDAPSPAEIKELLGHPAVIETLSIARKAIDALAPTPWYNRWYGRVATHLGIGVAGGGVGYAVTKTLSK